MSLQRLPADQALAQWDQFSAIVDARSPSEYALDHLPGAVNWPTLNDDERHIVGTLYKQVHPFDASKRGAVMAARNIANHIERELGHTPRQWQPLIYCWRGGKRSGALALVLDQIGLRVTLLDGGYKAFRAAVIADLPRLVQRLHYCVLCGPTGSGKTRLLGALAQAGAQVLDLEGLAQHRASVLGQVPGTAQPAQKRFETLLWQHLRALDPQRVVFIESESRKVGNLALPTPLFDAMRASPCVDVHLAREQRVQLLLEDYPHWPQEPGALCQRLEALTALRGKHVVQGWQAQVQVQVGDFTGLVESLLALHYDPGYTQSIRRSYTHYAKAMPLALADRHSASLAQAAQLLRAQCEAAPAA